MRVHCFQLDIVWEAKAENHEKVSRLMDASGVERGDLVLLPEMFATGFSMRVREIADDVTRETQTFMSESAARFGVYLAGGIVTTAPDGRGRNECVVFGPDGGEVGRYCKMHPFTYGGESRHYARGDRPLIFKCGPAAVAPFVCYDLRFPEVFRSAVVRGATVLAVIANWPTPRVGHWTALLKARAIENQAYVAGVNRCGSDPKLTYPGRSLIVDPQGNLLADGGAEESTISAELDLDALDEYRRLFPALADISPGYVA
jgi:predicted amidohydrolase